MGNGMNKVLPGLYIGNFRDAKDRQQLQDNNITHVLSIYDNASPILKDKKYLCIRAADTPDQELTQHFRKCIKFIHECRRSGGSVVVHCMAGVSRSVTVSVAYIVTVTDHSWTTALKAVRQSRTVANPNYGFRKQLQEFEDKHLDKERKWLRQKYGPVPSSDHEYIANLYKEYQKTHMLNTGSLSYTTTTPHSRPSGSYAATSSPLNRSEPYQFGSAATSSSTGAAQKNQRNSGGYYGNHLP